MPLRASGVVQLTVTVEFVTLSIVIFLGGELGAKKKHFQIQLKT